MDNVSAAQKPDATKFGEFMVNLLENHRDTFQCYLAETALIDWYGQTVKGSKNIGVFFKHKVGEVVHDFPVFQSQETIGYRDTHVVEYASSDDCIPELQSLNKVSPPKSTCSPRTPLNHFEMGQGDGVPMKKLKLTKVESEVLVCPPVLHYISAEGYVEFHRKSFKKLQSKTAWKRKTKLEFAYCGDTLENITIYMIIYQGNTRCRKNLLKDFEACGGME